MASDEAKATKVLLIEPPKAVWDLMGDRVAPRWGWPRWPAIPLTPLALATWILLWLVTSMVTVG